MGSNPTLSANKNMKKGCLFGVQLDGDADSEIRRIMESGVFGVRFPDIDSTKANLRNIWYAIFADLLTISPGDKVFFFAKRRIYGMAEVVGLGDEGTLGPILNYRDSDIFNKTPVGGSIYLGEDAEKVKVVVLLKPSPAFFPEGIDMDEVLSYPGAEYCWGLRFWSGKNFLQLGIEETRLLEGIFLRRFASLPRETRPKTSGYLEAQSRAEALGIARPSIVKMLADPAHAADVSGDKINREFAIHGALIEAIQYGTSALPAAFLDSKDYLLGCQREVPASPPKPHEYADFMDVVRFLAWSAERPVSIRFDIFEVKKDRMTGEALTIIKQLLEYVDFVARNYASGDYNTIRAGFIAAKFPDDVLSKYRTALAMTGQNLDVEFHKPYVLSTHGGGTSTLIWRNLFLMTYKWNGRTVEFSAA